MDAELRCNRLTCRKPLLDKAVVTTCSHIFCVECANELFNDARLCPACETLLSERDDVVVCSLNPTNDYKTSVLSGLSPSIILDICNRAISFWQYQIHQENSFQQAVVRNLNDTSAQLQKQLDNVVREANSELNILNMKISELERDLESERRKVRDLQETLRSQDKEYQKLKTHCDKIKRKALLAPPQAVNEAGRSLSMPAGFLRDRLPPDENQRHRTLATNSGNSVDLGAVVDGMDANGIQRTPLVNRTTGTFAPQPQANWQPPLGQPPVMNRKLKRQPFEPVDRPYRTGNASGSVSDVENLAPNPNSHRPVDQGAWDVSQTNRPNQRAVPTISNKWTGVFKPAR